MNTLSPPLIALTEEQQSAVDATKTWLSDSPNPERKLGGYAGTGKTTVIKSILSTLQKDHGIEVAAFTGKAVSVLRRKGVNAQTLHSLMYTVEQLPHGQVAFHKKDKLDCKPDLIIVDEASMISTELYNDLLSFKLKYLFVGDPGQLEPVGDNPDLMRFPDQVLSKIHRQAEKSPIITLATNVRHGQPLPYQDTEELVVRQKELKCSDAVQATQIICARNNTRNSMNQAIRRFKELTPLEIVPGEKLIVLRNNKDFGVFNGMILFVDEIKESGPDHWMVSAKDEVGNSFSSLPIWKRPFKQLLPKEFVIPRMQKPDSHDQIFGKPTKGPQMVLADYAYVITCHKSQGSEWSHVMVYDEYMPPNIWDMKRWRYTAITRASEKLTYLI